MGLLRFILVLFCWCTSEEKKGVEWLLPEGDRAWNMPLLLNILPPADFALFLAPVLLSRTCGISQICLPVPAGGQQASHTCGKAFSPVL